MSSFAPLDTKRIRVLPLAERQSMSRLKDILVDPESPAPECDASLADRIDQCADAIRSAREQDATVSLIYGAHLLRNGAALLIDELMDAGWITHLATNGAGTIHDWEFAFQGLSTESVRENVATGTFGSWDETGRSLHLALLAGGLEGKGYGESLGRMILDDGVTLPTIELLEEQLRIKPIHPATPARAELLQVFLTSDVEPGRHDVVHPFKHASIVAAAARYEIPLTVHPGIGYDIISNHPLFNGAVIGRAATVDYQRFSGAIERLDGGVVLSVGSAIMGPQVFEKSLSFVNNLRLQDDRPTVSGHSIYVVDLQEGGNWDWSQGEPPKTNPAYYLRFCKSYARMGGAMQYLCHDNLAFIHHLHHRLCHG
ncbi:MAG: hypothetical protein CMJ48_09510 [Planctomycetaceae bacterium]|nr:hypothetical protein [Planctomycetaceae bacterium]